MTYLKSQNAAAALLLMIIIAAIALVMALSLGLSAITENQMTLYQSESKQVFINADGCAEEAMTQMSRNHNYAGEILVIEGVTCTISVSGVGANRTLTINATDNIYSRTIEIDVKIFPTVYITSWQELAT